MKRTQLAQKLSLLDHRSQRKLTSFLVGFDGFTDEIITAVDIRRSPTSYSAIDTIAAFAQRISEAAGKSCNLEFISKKIKIGGNGPILAQALVAFGYKPALIGCLGETCIEPLFEPLTKECKEVISLAASGHTDAIEFTDGKLLFGKHQPVLTITKELIQKKIPSTKLIQLLKESDTFVSVNWTMIPAMTEIWEWLLSEILPHIKSQERIFFVDLADPAKRSDDDLRSALASLKKLKAHYKIHLGLNEKESDRVLKLLQEAPIQTTSIKKAIQAKARAIQERSELDVIIIHATKMAACSSSDETCFVDGPFCKTPYLSTGGGDNFNAGYLFGLGCGFSMEEALLIGKATSGFYIRAGKSPSRIDLAHFLRTWDRNPHELEELIP